MTPPRGGLPDLGALAGLAPELAKTFVSLSSDIALVIDRGGIIREVAQGDVNPLVPAAYDWVGRHWVDTVSGDTRGKIENLLQEVASTGIGRRREVTHPLQAGASIPVAYSAVRFGMDGPVLATGRDLRAIVAIQQRFLESQQEMELGYWQARQSETRYRLLFQVATDAVLVVDAQSLCILESNRAASEMFDLTSEQLLQRPLPLGFAERSRAKVNALLETARSSGQSGEIRAQLLGKVTQTSVSATPFRAEDTMRLLVRVRSFDESELSAALSDTLARLVDDISDGVVVTDSSGRIRMANPAFLRLVQLNSEEEVRGQSIMDWLGMDEGLLTTVLPQVRRDGLIRKIPSWIKVAHAAVARVELSATLLTEGDQECIGFTIHRVEVLRDLDRSPYELNLAIQQLTAQVGKVPLPALMQQVAEMAERHLVRTALMNATNDTAGAATALGISHDDLLERMQRLGERAN